MLRALSLTLLFADDQMTRRRRHRFAPSLTGATSCLEDRVVLSAVGSMAGAVVHQTPGSPTTPGNGSVPPIIADPPAPNSPGHPLV
jgi:hypothetical protein